MNSHCSISNIIYSILSSQQNIRFVETKFNMINLHNMHIWQISLQNGQRYRVPYTDLEVGELVVPTPLGKWKLIKLPQESPPPGKHNYPSDCMPLEQFSGYMYAHGCFTHWAICHRSIQTSLIITYVKLFQFGKFYLRRVYNYEAIV